MKTRRALQMVVAILAVTVLACLVAAMVFVALVQFFPDLSKTINEVYDVIAKGFSVVANKIGLANVAFLVPLLGCGLPASLLLIASILLFSRNKYKKRNYITGCVLALIGATVLCVFIIWFAPELLSWDPSISYKPTIAEEMAGAALYVRIAFGVLLALFVVFVGCALGIKPKNPEKAKETSVATNKEDSYQQPTPETEEKIKKAKKLYEIGAITQEEYQKIKNIYLKK